MKHELIKRMVIFILAATLAVSVFESIAFAQEEAAGTSNEKSFIDVYLSGGFTMHLLLIQSVIMLTFSIEGFIKLRKAKLAPPALVSQLRDILAQGNYQQAYDTCKANPCFLTKVLSEALLRIGKGRDAFETVLSDRAIKEAAKTKSNLNYLSVIGVTAPMFGLFGTVLGMIGAFNTLAKEGVSDFGALAANISTALVTTAGGLVVGVPAFILYYLLRNNAQGALTLADTELAELVEDFPLDQLIGFQIAGGASQAAAYGAPGGYPAQGAPQAYGQAY